MLETIKYMDCGGGVSCFANKKKHDEEFLRYVSLAKRFALHLYRDKQGRNPEKIIRYYASKLNFIPDTIIEKAIEIARKHWNKLHVRKYEIIFVASIMAACRKEFNNNELCYTLRSQICKKLHMIPYNINKIVKQLLEEPE